MAAGSGKLPPTPAADLKPTWRCAAVAAKQFGCKGGLETRRKVPSMRPAFAALSAALAPLILVIALFAGVLVIADDGATAMRHPAAELTA